MDKKLAGLLGAVAGLATMSAANAAVQDSPASPLPAAASYAELLGPISNAPEALVADDAARMQQSEARVQLAQYHHHHHHHTRIIIRHHHHHHHRRIIIRRRHHHHHHHHSMYMPGVVKKA